LGDAGDCEISTVYEIKMIKKSFFLLKTTNFTIGAKY